MKCLVTGGNGFIGSAVISRLIKNGHHVLSMGRSGKNQFISENILREIETVKGDVRNSEKVDLITKNCEQIYHFAGIVDSDSASGLSVDSIETEIQGLRNVCKSALKNNVEKVIYGSSCSVYGDDECQKPLTEELSVFPQSHYAVLKRLGELLLKSYHEEYNLCNLILRIFNPYGSNQPKNMVIQRFFHAAINNLPIQIYGTGSQTRDFIYIDDLAKAIVLSGDKIVNSEIVNVCTGKDITIANIAEVIISMTDSKSDCQFLPTPNNREEAELARSYGSITKLQSLTNFVPDITIKEGLMSMYSKIKIEKK
jgi:nucleoside-diphosphate-sugar epimerase